MIIWETMRGALIFLCIVMIASNTIDSIQRRVKLWQEKRRIDDERITELAKEVIAGKWGNGEERKRALRKAGHDYEAVQNRVNEIMLQNFRKLELRKQQEEEREAFNRADIGDTFICDGSAYIKTSQNCGQTRDFKHFVSFLTPNEMRERAGLEPKPEPERPGIEILLDEPAPFWSVDIGGIFVYENASYIKTGKNTAQMIGENQLEGFSLFDEVKPVPLHRKNNQPETEIKRFKDIKIGGRFEHNGENFIKVNTWRSRSETHTDLWYEFPQTLKVKAYKEDK